MTATYLDSSAIVKLALREAESSSLRRYLRTRRPLVSSALARTEVARALLPAGTDALTRGRLALAPIDLLRVSDRVLTAAGILEPLDLRSLDAIHLATAIQLGGDLGTLVTYDVRMREAAQVIGLRVAAPS